MTSIEETSFPIEAEKINSENSISSVEKPIEIVTEIDSKPLPIPVVKPRTDKQKVATATAREKLALKRKNTNDQKQSHEVAHLKEINNLLAANQLLRQEVFEMAAQPLPKIPQREKKLDTPPPSSPIAIQKPRTAYTPPPQMSANRLLMTMGF